MASGHERLEAELRIAVSEKYISAEEGETLLEECRRRGMGLLALLHDRGLISEETFAQKSQQALAGMHPQNDTFPSTVGVSVPSFPIPGWDRFEDRGFLGQGGMGQVFRAQDLRLNRAVALKFVKGDDAGLVRRLLSEARSQARVEHERICQVYDVGEVRGRPYIAMQLIQGPSLVQCADTLTVEQKVLVIRGAAEGVQAAHRAGIIHRDLKPSNILVERLEDGSLKPYVVDFGLARAWNEESATTTGAVLGTPHYMSPEQALGEVARLDRRTDIYSLGATLYALLTGQPPFMGSNALEVLHKLRTEEPRSPRALNPDIPWDLESIVLKCLEKDRSARYDSARALIEDLDRFLAGEPIQARALGAWDRLWKRARKHKLLVSGAAAALLSFAFALGWTLYIRAQASLRDHIFARVEKIEYLSRLSALGRVHDTRQDQREIREEMDGVVGEMQKLGDIVAGPGHYALGRGYLALGEDALARQHLEAAWEDHFREPRVAWNLAWVLGRLYQAQLREDERLLDPPQRELRKRQLISEYRELALGYLHQSQGPESDQGQKSGSFSSGYIAALIAFYENRFDDALNELDKIKDPSVWYYEIPLLRGNIQATRAIQQLSQGRAGGGAVEADLHDARNSYHDAAQSAPSSLEVYQGRAALEYEVLVSELYGRGRVKDPFDQGMDAVSIEHELDPDNVEAWLQESRLQRRFAEASVGDNQVKLLQLATQAAQKAAVLAPINPDVQLELFRCHQLSALTQQAHDWRAKASLHLALDYLEMTPQYYLTSLYSIMQGLGFELNASFLQGEASWREIDKAMAAYDEALQLDTSQAAARLNLCNLYVGRSQSPYRKPGDLDRAMDLSEMARARHPQMVPTYTCAGNARVQRAQWERPSSPDIRPLLNAAMGQYSSGLQLNDKQPVLLNLVGSVFLEQAREEWRHGGDPFPLLGQAQKRFMEAKRNGSPDNSAYSSSEAWIQQAQYEFALKRAGAARESLENADGMAREAYAQSHQQTVYLPKRVNSLQLLAALELEQGRNPLREVSEAERYARKALTDDPKQYEVRRYLGETLAIKARWNGDHGAEIESIFEEARQNLEWSISEAPIKYYFQLAYARVSWDWATWRRRRGEERAEQLRRGLEQIDTVLRDCRYCPEAHVLRFALLLEQTRTVPPSADRQTVHDAYTEFKKALADNPHLEPEWASLLAEWQ